MPPPMPPELQKKVAFEPPTSCMLAFNLLIIGGRLSGTRPSVRDKLVWYECSESLALESHRKASLSSGLSCFSLLIAFVAVVVVVHVLLSLLRFLRGRTK
jgi:hypothetical protein